MARIHGPPNPRLFRVATGRFDDSQAFVTDATTLGQALAAYAMHFGVRLVPLRDATALGFESEPGKYFEFCTVPGERGFAVDVHVLRGGIDICARQELGLVLEEGDVVTLDMLAC
jgi:hypothetical protein